MFSAQDRLYYRDMFGFDPDCDQHPLAEGSGFYYEEFFSLAKDPMLIQDGITIGARVISTDGKCLNRIIMRRGDIEASVDCVHTAIYSIPAGQLNDSYQMTTNLREIVEFAQTTEKREIYLPPEEHFAALKSYVAGIAEIGITTMLRTAYITVDDSFDILPFGFNIQMQRQVISAILRVSPRTGQYFLRDTLLEIAELAPRDWFMSRLALFGDIFPFWAIVISDPATFTAMDDILASEVFRYKVAKIPSTSPMILSELARDQHYFIRRAVASNPSTPEGILNVLQRDENLEVRQAATGCLDN